jgi:hypothetical protein
MIVMCSSVRAAMAGSTCDLSLFSRTGCRAYILSVQKQIQPLKCE